MLLQKRSLDTLLERCLRLGKETVLGGPMASSSPEGYHGVSHLIQGEAERILPRFFQDLKTGNALSLYKADEKPDLREAPIPRFDLCSLDDYGSMALQFSRGCPFNCEFCDIIELFGRIPRTKTPERMLAELNALRRRGYRGSVFFVDDNFIGNAPKVKDFLRVLIPWQKKHGRPFTFFTESSVNLAQDAELLALMAEAGFRMAFLGIETPVESSLRCANKGQNLKADLALSVRKIQAAGIEVTAGFILGFDTDPLDIAQRQIDFISKAGIPTAMIGLLTALPGTQLAKRLEAEGRLLAASSGNNTFASKLNFIPAMPLATLMDSYDRVVAELYQPSAYFQRCTTLLSRLPAKLAAEGGHVGFKPTLMYAAALLRSLFIQGLSRYGFYYGKFLLETLIKRPRRIVDAVKLAIFGHHFFRLRELKVLDRQRGTVSLRSRMDKVFADIAATERRLLGLSAASAAAATRALFKRLIKTLSPLPLLIRSGYKDLVDVELPKLGYRISLPLYGIGSILAEKAMDTPRRPARSALKRLEAAQTAMSACLENLRNSCGSEISAIWDYLSLIMDNSLTKPIHALSVRV